MSPDGGEIEDAADPWSQKRGRLPWKNSHGEVNFVIDCRAVGLGIRTARDHYFVNPIDSKFVIQIVEARDDQSGAVAAWVRSGWSVYKREWYRGEHGRHPDGAILYTGTINPERGIFFRWPGGVTPQKNARKRFVGRSLSIFFRDRCGCNVSYKLFSVTN